MCALKNRTEAFRVPLQSIRQVSTNRQFRGFSLGRCVPHGALVARLALILAVWLAASPAAAAQSAPVAKTNIEGKVLDESRATVPGARVDLRCRAFTAGAVTGSDGAFSFAAPPAASCTVSAQASGFSVARRSLVAPPSGTVRITLVLAPVTQARQIVVTAARTPTPLSETPLGQSRITSAQLRNIAALSLDGALRQVPGFSLFRRTDSRVANPTIQGVSLRGLGASGASRALVLEDGFPLNDPFGSWVYWGRVPRESIESVEVLQEGASSLYGSGALGGVVQFLTRPAVPGGLSLETSYGNENTPDFSLWTGGQKGRWEAKLGAGIFHTDGYILIAPSERGSVDTPAGSTHETLDLTIGRNFGPRARVFGRGWFYDESRRNGTPLQRNSTSLGEGALGADTPLGNLGFLSLRFYGEAENLAQTFSAVAADRMSERLTNSQHVPSQMVGGSLLWTRGAGTRQTLVAGLDAQEVLGASNEQLFAPAGNVFALQSSGGRQRLVGVFGEDLIRLGSRWLVTLSGRWDHWRNFDGSSTRTPLAPAGPPATTPFADRSENAFSPRVTVLDRLGKGVWLSAAFYRAFRAPTLNELYRSFRVGNVVTSQNADLGAERLTGTEAGLGWNLPGGRAQLRGSFFWNVVNDPIANVTLAVDPSLILRQRQNLGSLRSAGLELDSVFHLTRQWQLSAGYQYANSVVTSFPPDPSLVGLWVPQVPRHVLTFESTYAWGEKFTLGVDGRFVGNQYDDDLNLFLLGRFFVLDLSAAREMGHGIQLYFAAENLFNQSYAVQATPVPELGLPFTARAGFRYQLPFH
jgi:outer membrane receptor protein involved in Fe transport